MHCIDVTIFSLIVGIRKKFNDTKLITLGNAALLHEIGKLFIQDKESVKIGYDIVKSKQFIPATTISYAIE
jgi:HD-GYP domain-containing protein (c-di-GMP phosphodiesterase class II)